jgi:hypothetical protein
MAPLTCIHQHQVVAPHHRGIAVVMQHARIPTRSHLCRVMEARQGRQRRAQSHMGSRATLGPWVAPAAQEPRRRLTGVVHTPPTIHAHPQAGLDALRGARPHSRWRGTPAASDPRPCRRTRTRPPAGTHSSPACMTARWPRGRQLTHGWPPGGTRSVCVCVCVCVCNRQDGWGLQSAGDE